MTRPSNQLVARLRDVATWPDLPPDRYELRRLLGRGGMGAVYAAYDRRLEREVAIKVSNAPAARSALERRLRHEARVLAHLEHPGIVPVHDAGELADGRWFYVMKLVEGRTLAEHMPVGGEAGMLGVFERIAETVAFAHAAGIVHRDLKPTNIMVGSFGQVTVLDWGVARVLGAASHAHAPEDETPLAERPRPDATATGTRIGTAGFMPPEQARGDAEATGPAADVYALGALASWMLMDQPRGASRRLRAIILRCLADDPAARYPDAAALVDDLARYRAGLSVAAHRESTLERLGRGAARHRAFILLVVAYLVMRAAFAWWQRT